ncbi:MAG: histidinol dehydrogenase [Candidatus Howiella sp.]|jgi:histidinol dehydrogenase
MIKIVEADGRTEKEALAQIEARGRAVNDEVTAAVTGILRDVQQNGDAAVDAYTLKFDGALPKKRLLDRADMEAAMQTCTPDFLRAMERAAENISDFHKRQVQQSWFTTKADGVMLGQRVRGLRRVGIYVPGGTAAYPSSVLMNAIPAKIAGVEEVIMVTPPAKRGEANPDILAAAYIAGVDKIFLCGGAQAVAAITYGTETVPRVDKIVGPGNIFVATAKRLVFGTVDIDMVAGPSEILIVADRSADPVYLAADLLSQAEHDRLASAMLVVTDRALAERTAAELDRQLDRLDRREIAAESIQNYGIILVCADAAEAMRLANELAPEHLEICLENPMQYLGLADNAGSVFLGNYSPEPLGDYFAGPNHVLPTGGTARFFSPLSVDSFVKKVSFIQYSETALKACGEEIITLAEHEGLTAHANSVRVRL